MSTKGEEKKEEIFKHTILTNIKRKSKYVDQVQMYDGIPLFSWIDINVTELCNRKCEFCPRIDATNYPNQNLNMTVSLAQRIASELKDLNFAGGVIFSGHSEPILNKDILGIVASFGSGVHTEMVTNGDKLSVQLIKDLFSAGLGVLLVSMYDGPFQIEYFSKMFADASIDEGFYVLRDRWYTIEEDYGVKLTNRAGSVTTGHQQEIEESRPCYYTHYSMQLDWNGDVLLCVQDFSKKIRLGNLYQRSLVEIWQSPNMNKYRKTLGRGFRAMYPCSQCNVNGTLHGNNHLRAWQDIEQSNQ